MVGSVSPSRELFVEGPDDKHDAGLAHQRSGRLGAHISPVCRASPVRRRTRGSVTGEHIETYRDM